MLHIYRSFLMTLFKLISVSQSPHHATLDKPYTYFLYPKPHSHCASTHWVDMTDTVVTLDPTTFKDAPLPRLFNFINGLMPFIFQAPYLGHVLDVSLYSPTVMESADIPTTLKLSPDGHADFDTKFEPFMKSLLEFCKARFTYFKKPKDPSTPVNFSDILGISHGQFILSNTVLESLQKILPVLPIDDSIRCISDQSSEGSTPVLSTFYYQRINLGTTPHLFAVSLQTRKDIDANWVSRAYFSCIPYATAA